MAIGNPSVVNDAFLKGIVFGFDIGTGSIGYAVRRGNEFLDVGVLICPEDTSDLSGRRGLRRQRRTLRSKKYRRKWLEQELVKLGLPKPTTNHNDPVALRLRAVNGEKLPPEELHSAIAHLWKRRGYLDGVPWENQEGARRDGDAKKEVGVIKESISKLREDMKNEGCDLPCQFLTKHPDNQRRRVWPRDLLEKEFRAIVTAQSKNCSKLAEKTDWLLYGDSKRYQDTKGKEHFVFHKSTEGRNPGVLGLRWPRFDNRGPALDSWQPIDGQGRPLHVVRKKKVAYEKAQWELALMNFRVVDAKTHQKRDPRIDFPTFVTALRQEWDKKGKVTQARLKTLAKPFADRFLLIEDQKPLTPESGSGRAKYSSLTLDLLRKEIADGRRVDPPQPVLRRDGESLDQALDRYLTDIKHPLVRHRLILFRRLLNQLIEKHGTPSLVIVEAVRSIALSQKNKNELNKRNEEHRKDRENARSFLAAEGQSVSKNSILRYRLWKEAKGRCPFCLCPFCLTELLLADADIEHLVPRRRVDCNEFYNLTVAHVRCNRELKKDRTPYEAFHPTENWDALKKNAADCFRGRKLEIFLSPNAEELIESTSDLVQTSYIAKVLRHICLIRLGWVGKDGRDPTDIKKADSLKFQVTNGQLTSRLRQSWGLNHALYDKPAEDTEEAWRQYTEKNRGDLRHHALDAMVISCTLPWLAHRTHGAGGWWTTDHTNRSVASNPVGLNFAKVKDEIAKAVVGHHVSRSNHQQAYATTLYAKRDKDTYVAREVFTSLKPKDFDDIFPKKLGAYCAAAWLEFEAETTDLADQLKKSKGCLPESFTRKLCFADFQRWRATGAPEFAWPKEVKIPIRNVRLISVKDDSAVMPFSKGTNAFVKRKTYKAVHIHLSADGKRFVPALIPYWQGDTPVCNEPIDPSYGIITVIKKGQAVELKKTLAAGYKPGRYIVTDFGQVQVIILPGHIADNDDARVSFGLPRTGIKPRWHEFVCCLGYELPHSPSSKSESAGAAKA